MRVLVTRAPDEAQRTAQELAARGHVPLLAPLSDVRALAGPEPALDGVQAIMATSSNGVRAFAARCRRRDIPIYCVGASTAAAAREAGFHQTKNVDGDAMTLTAEVRKSLDARAGALLHATGTNVAPQLRQNLEEAGFEVRTCALYEIVPRAGLTAEIVAVFRRGEIDAVLVLSPASGRTFVENLKRAVLESKCTHMTACCISAAAAEKIGSIAFGEIRIAEKPDLASVLALLDLGPVRAHG
jgi:uroporphyrinogen-III synthase